MHSLPFRCRLSSTHAAFLTAPRPLRVPQERAALAARLPPAAEELALMLVPTDEADSRDAVLEVRAGAGGDEASLFAMDLLRMYERYAARQPGWRFEILR